MSSNPNATAATFRRLIKTATQITHRIQDCVGGDWWTPVEPLTAQLESDYRKLPGRANLSVPDALPPFRVRTVFEHEDTSRIDYLTNPCFSKLIPPAAKLQDGGSVTLLLHKSPKGMPAMVLRRLSTNSTGQSEYKAEDGRKETAVLKAWLQHWKNKLVTFDFSTEPYVPYPSGFEKPFWVQSHSKYVNKPLLFDAQKWKFHEATMASYNCWDLQLEDYASLLSGNEYLFSDWLGSEWLIISKFNTTGAEVYDQASYRFIDIEEAIDWFAASPCDRPKELDQIIEAKRREFSLVPATMEPTYRSNFSLPDDDVALQLAPVEPMEAVIGKVDPKPAGIVKLELETPELDPEDWENWVKASELKKHKESASVDSFQTQRSRGLKTDDKLFGVDEVGRIYRKHGNRVWYYAPSLLPCRDKNQPLISQSLTLISTLDLPLIR